jgi:hypothetical protein
MNRDDQVASLGNHGVLQTKTILPSSLATRTGFSFSRESCTTVVMPGVRQFAFLVSEHRFELQNRFTYLCFPVE